VYTVLRRYLQAMNVVRPIMLAVAIANVLNAVGNWIFVYGHLGAPALGVVGSAYATLAARIGLAITLWMVVVHRERRRPSGLHDVPFQIDIARMWQLVRLGIAAALQIALEVGVFAVAGGLAARISPTALAANQIVLNIAGFFFMVPYGLSSAAAVRVGQAVGRRDAHGVRVAGWSALALALGFAFCVAGWFVIGPTPLLRIFTRDAGVIATGITLLAICAFFQPFDGFQTVTTGALRGLGDTRSPMLTNLAGHWLIGLPVAYHLCFTRDWGVTGLWVGLSIGLILIGAVLLVVWWRAAARVFFIQ
jgi:MATE family multidrug resistance protein